MSFLDRFKPQPRWKHADPVVRAAAVGDVPDDDEALAVLTELGSADEDVRVRRAASLRIYEVPTLVSLARSERDPELKRELADRLVATATAGDAGVAAQALEGLEDERQLASVAMGSPHETVRTAALARVQDVRLLGSIARKAMFGQTALEAAARIPDQAELVNVAIKTEHKDAGIAALERAAESIGAGGDLRETLTTVGSRAKNKSVSKRARMMMQAIEEAEAARRTALETWQQKVAGLVARVEALAAVPASAGAATELSESEAAWAGLGADEGLEIDPDSAARFTAAVESARAAIAEQQRLEEERRAADAARAALRARGATVVERIAGCTGDDLLDQAASARAEWEGLGIDTSDPEAEALRARLEEACARAERRHQDRLVMTQTLARLEELSVEAERIAAAEDLPQDAWDSLASEWTALHPRAEGLSDVVVERYTQAAGRVGQRAEERKAVADRGLRQHVQRVEQLVERAQKRATAEDLTLREADRLVRDVRAALEAPPPVDETERQGLVERLKAASAVLTPKLHELREMDEWKRFANAAVQEELIARTEALRVKYGLDAPEPPAPAAEGAAAEGATAEAATAERQEQRELDLDKAARELHDIQERWKSVAEAPRAQAQALWHRYRQAADPVQARLKEFFAQRNEERKGNLEKKLALIARAEALADSTDWIKTADELKKLQAEWQQLGPVPRQETKTTWKRFRDACDSFFTRRNADLAERKETWSANLARKEALCSRAEELAASKDWDKAAAEIRRLQVDWKTIGPVRRNKSDAVWQRFRTACDTFFDRYKRRDEIEIESKQADREGLVAELEALGPADAPGIDGVDAAGLLERVRSLRSRWNQSTPVVRHGADPLSARFVTALERTLASHPDAFKGTELDVEPNRQKMEKLIARVEGFLTESAPAPANSSQALAEMLREALASNTIGGRAGEEEKWRTLAEEVRQAQAAWSRLGPVPGDQGRALNERFHRATSKFFETYRRKVPQAPAPSRHQRPVGTR